MKSFVERLILVGLVLCCWGMKELENGKPHAEGQVLLQDLIDRLSPHFGELEGFLRRQIEAFEPEVRPLVEYTLGHSGKKLRPVLVFLSGYSGEGQMKPELIRAAAIVELVHLATLVHDDILDDASLRHRTETVREKYGDHAAVLLGDALFAHALKLATEYETTEVCRIVAESTRQVCSGEIAQTFARGETNLELGRYYRMIDLKTAELFAASAELGALLGDGRDDVVEAAQIFARHLGIAFQIYDDLADFLSSEEKAGKTLGTDLASGKYTLPFLLWFESLSEQEGDKVKQSLVKGQVELELWRQKMTEARIFEQVMERFEAELASALSALDGTDNWFGKVELPTLVHFLRQATLKLNSSV